VDHMQVAVFCYRESAEVHQDPEGMRYLAVCHSRGQGVTADPAQAAAWLQKAADTGDAASNAIFGTFLLDGDASLGIVKNVARGFELLREAVAQPGYGLAPGYGIALYRVAVCYVTGVGVDKDAAHGVSLLQQLITQGDPATAKAQVLLARCYVAGDGVDVDLKQATK